MPLFTVDVIILNAAGNDDHRFIIRWNHTGPHNFCAVCHLQIGI